jgi:hypothetical protein
MISRIPTLEAVITFTKEIIAEGTRIHPKYDFREMVNMETNEPTDLRN